MNDDLVECLGVAHCEGYEYEAEQATDYVFGLEAKVEELETKLEKALYFIKDLTGCEWPYNDDATRVLAELKGEEE